MINVVIKFLMYYSLFLLFAYGMKLWHRNNGKGRNK